jgi:hypothetical protein
MTTRTVGISLKDQAMLPAVFWSAAAEIPQAALV